MLLPEHGSDLAVCEPDRWNLSGTECRFGVHFLSFCKIELANERRLCTQQCDWRRSWSSYDTTPARTGAMIPHCSTGWKLT
jgi:hypothetical protein